MIGWVAYAELEHEEYKKEQDKVQIDDSETEMNINENEKLETKQQVFSFKTSSEKKTTEYNLPKISLLEKKQSKQLISGAIHINNRNDHLGIQAWSFMDIDRSKQL